MLFSDLRRCINWHSKHFMVCRKFTSVWLQQNIIQYCWLDEQKYACSYFLPCKHALKPALCFPHAALFAYVNCRNTLSPPFCRSLSLYFACTSPWAVICSCDQGLAPGHQAICPSDLARHDYVCLLHGKAEKKGTPSKTPSLTTSFELQAPTKLTQYHEELIM